MRVAWISYSGIRVSETFLAATVSALRDVAEVRALSGTRFPQSDLGREAGLVHLGFAARPESKVERIRRALDRADHYWRRVQRDCLSACLPQLQSFRPDVLWFDYGTTAVMAEGLIERMNCPFVVAIHGYDVCSGFKNRFYELGFGRVAPAAAAFVCASHHMRRLAILGGANPDGAKVIRLGLDSESVRREPSIAKTADPSFVHLGRLTWQKNPLATLQAFALVRRRLPEAKLTFIGDGHLRGDLELRCAALGLSGCVHFAGAMSHAAALRLAQSHWVFVQHSTTGIDGAQEGFALSPAEAALMEMPVVSTFHDGIPEHVLDGVTGFLVPEFDFEAMAERMIALAGSAELRARMGQAGRANIAEMCSMGARARNIRELLAGVCTGSTAR